MIYSGWEMTPIMLIDISFEFSYLYLRISVNQTVRLKICFDKTYFYSSVTRLTYNIQDTVQISHIYSPENGT